ncbi:MAG: transcriptional regulator [Gammaproteobacteria bacterium]|nr:transcriptional regulator [Gammaproteobacteria bacterium]
MSEQVFLDLYCAMLELKTSEEVEAFLRDLCTPMELKSLAERWQVCRLLDSGKYSYREIHQKTGASLTTIGRVARFLKDEPYHGYRAILKRIPPL